MRVRLTRDAHADLTAILEYLGERSPSGARAVLAAIERAFDLMAQRPRAAQATDNPQVRMKLVGKYPYKIFYRIESDCIEVIHIRHSARRPWQGELL